MSIATGCIGLSLDDFERCTPSEFAAIFDGWSSMQRQQMRQAWEQTRMTCLCILQPHSKNPLKPQDVMRFEWDDAEKSAPREELSPQEIQRRFAAAKKRYGLK